MEKEIALLGSSKRVKEAKRLELQNINKYRRLLGMAETKLNDRLKGVKYKKKKFFIWSVEMSEVVKGHKIILSLSRLKNGSLACRITADSKNKDTALVLNNSNPLYGVNISVLMKRIIRKIRRESLLLQKKSKGNDKAALTEEWLKVYQAYANILKKSLGKVGGDRDQERETYKDMPEKLKPLASLREKIVVASGK